MNLASLFVDVGYKDNAVDVGIGKTHGQLVGLSAMMSATGKVGSSMWGVLAGGAAAATAALSLHEIIGATMEAEKGQRALKSALMATGQEVENNLESMTDFADQIKTTYNVDDDLVIASQALATNLGVQANQMKAVITTAVGLSNVMDTDLKTATESVVKATQGGFREFERLSPQMKQMTSDTEKLAFVQVLASRGLLAQKDSVNTMGGAMQALNLATSDLGKSLGAAFGPALTTIVHTATNVMDGLREAVLTVEETIEKLSNDSPANTKLTDLRKQLADIKSGSKEATGAARLHLGAVQAVNEAYSRGKMSITDLWFAAGEAQRKATANAMGAMTQMNAPAGPAGGKGGVGNLAAGVREAERQITRANYDRAELASRSPEYQAYVAQQKLLRQKREEKAAAEAERVRLKRATTPEAMAIHGDDVEDIKAALSNERDQFGNPIHSGRTVGDVLNGRKQEVLSPELAALRARRKAEYEANRERAKNAKAARLAAEKQNAVDLDVQQGIDEENFPEERERAKQRGTTGPTVSASTTGRRATAAEESRARYDQEREAAARAKARAEETVRLQMKQSADQAEKDAQRREQGTKGYLQGLDRQKEKEEQERQKIVRDTLGPQASAKSEDLLTKIAGLLKDIRDNPRPAVAVFSCVAIGLNALFTLFGGC